MKIDQCRPTIETDNHVLLLVQIVVAHAARVDFVDEFGESLEKIEREFVGC